MQNKVMDIGEIKGKMLLFGGVYSNLQALQQFQKIAEEENVKPENIICTGDIVGYCAQPDECLQAIKKWNINSISGNVEIQLRDDSDDCGCNFNEGSRCKGFSQQWFPYAKVHVSDDSVNWIKHLPEYIQFTYQNKKCVVVHGSYFETSEYIFKSTPWKIKQNNFDESGAEIIIAGHCGLPFHDENNNKIWLNPGVIGMPANDGTARVWYMILYDEDELKFENKNFLYDNTSTFNLMKEKNLPDEYAQTLITGMWDNCEILPKVETERQGKRI